MPRNPRVNYYLKKEGKDGLCAIFLQYKYSGKRLTYSFGQRIKRTNWDKDRDRVRDLKATTADGQFLLNDLLDILPQRLRVSYHQHLKNGIPSPLLLKKDLDLFYKQNHEIEVQGPTLYSLIERFISGEIKFKGRSTAQGTRYNYNTVLNHVKAFEEKKKYRIHFDTITLDFYYKYTDFLEKDLKLQSTTIAKDIRLIKRFMGEAVDLNYTTNAAFKHSKFCYSENETDAVYLSEEEIMKIYKFSLTNNKRLEKVRDLFVFGCFVGLRYSDYSDIKKENIKEDEGEYFINVLTKKTKEHVIVLCQDIVLEIFDKYKMNPNSLPPSISLKSFNPYIREVCKAVGLTEKGRLSTSLNKELWECITSHTARRSFATNLYLNGIHPIDIMKLTGHRSEKSLLRYIKVSNLETAKKVGQVMKNKYLLRLAKVTAI